MNKEEEPEIVWLISHDSFLRHFTIEMHANATVSAKEILNQLQELVQDYSDNPARLLDDSNLMDPQ